MAFVVTSGQIQAVQRIPDYRWWGHASRGLSLSPTLTMTYEQLWRAQPALRMVTSFIARNVASLGLDPYRRLSDTDREKAGDHPLARLLETPVPGQAWTKFRLINTLLLDLLIFDEAYWLKQVDGQGLRGIQPIPPAMVRPLGSNGFSPSGYRITGSRSHRDVSPDDIVHFHGYNPSDGLSGVPPIETLRMILAEEHAAQTYREQMWRNGARVAGYLQRPKDAPRWEDSGRQRFKAEWQAQYAGDGPNTGGTPILEDGMTFEGSSVTPKDAQYVESRQLTQREVAIAYFIPPVMVGIMDSGSNFASVAEFHRMLYQDTLAPWLVQISQDVERQLLPDIDPDAARDGSIYVEFNLKGKLSGSFAEQSKALQSATGGPWMTRNEARAMDNLPAVDGGDELIVPLNVVTGGLASPNDTAPNKAAGPDHATVRDALVSFFDRQRDVLARKTGGGAEPFNLDRWNAELAADLRAIGITHAPVGRLNADTRDRLSIESTAQGIVSAFADWSASDRAGHTASRWGFGA